MWLLDSRNPAITDTTRAKIAVVVRCEMSGSARREGDIDAMARCMSPQRLRPRRNYDQCVERSGMG